MDNKVINRKRQTIIYLIITFGITYMTWGYIAIYTQINQVEFSEVPILYLFYILGVIAPMIGAVAVKIRFDLKNFTKSVFLPKIDILTFLFILVMAFLTRMLPSIIETKALSFSLVVFTQIPLFILFGGLEEIGWRGILHQNLDTFGNQIKTGLIVGLIWTIWHLPLFFILGTYQNLQGDFLIFLLNTLAFSVMLGVVYHRTRNIFTCILFHALMNSIANTYLVSDNLLTAIIVFAFTMISSYLALRYLPTIKLLRKNRIASTENRSAQ